MGNVWKVHKYYILAVAAGALALAVWYGWFIRGLDEESMAIQKQRLRKETELQVLLENGLPEEATVHRAKADVRNAGEALDILVKDLMFRMPDAYTPPDVVTRKQHFDSMKISVYEKLRDLSVQRQLLPSQTLGFGELPDDYGDDAAGELLLRLAVVEFLWKQIVESLGDEGGKVDEINARHNYEDVTEGSSWNARAFLNPVEVHIKFTADSRCVFSVLHGIQQHGKYLSVLDFKAMRANPSRDVMTAEMVVAALRLSPQGSLVPPEEEEEEAGDDW
ncbi:MAG: hypothetical protein ACYTAF_16170 [Planctomycetota bacterium]|jgi:hypothetical protein